MQTCAASLSCTCSTISAMVDLFSLHHKKLKMSSSYVKIPVCLPTSCQKQYKVSWTSQRRQKSHPPPERRSECPVSCSLDSCLSRRCLSLSLRRTSRPPWPSCSLDVCLSSVRRSRLSACSLHTSWGSSSLRAWISCSLESCLSILWSLWKVLVWTWGSAWSLRIAGVPLEASLSRYSRPGSCSTTSAMTATSALPVPTSPIISSLSLPFSRTFSSRLATISGVTASSMCLILGCRR